MMDAGQMDHGSLASPHAGWDETQEKIAGLLRLPNELLESILMHLEPYQVAKLNLVCRRFHTVISQDVSWKKRFLQLGISKSIDSPFPFESWKDLYLAHYPYWFIPQHRVWFADSTELDGGLCGQLLLACYQPATGTIEAYRVVGQRSEPNHQVWPERPDVSIHIFNPRVRLHLAEPVVRLRGTRYQKHDPGVSLPATSSSPFFRQASSPTAAYPNRQPFDCGPGLRSMKPAGNDLNQTHNVVAQVMLAQAIAPEFQHPSQRLWPPPRLPAVDRVRRSPQQSIFSSMGLTRRRGSSGSGSSGGSGSGTGTSFQRPTAHVDVCQSAFRFQKQVAGPMAAFYNMLRSGMPDPPRGTTVLDGFGLHGTGVSTFATLPHSAYRPTPERPYQGIWVGDYAGHGCEFLLIRQKITKQEVEASEKLSPYYHRGEIYETIEELLNNDIDWENDDNDNDDDDDENYYSANETVYQSPFVAATTANSAGGASSGRRQGRQRRRLNRRNWNGLVNEPTGEKGRLEAIKLTGDPNVPRAEFTFVAEDIGERGQIYVSDSEMFKDKRVVCCWGHIAGHGFTEDVFIQTDLILMSHDVLAQHWHGFNHVAFYRRVDIDAHYDELCSGGTLQL